MVGHLSASSFMHDSPLSPRSLLDPEAYRHGLDVHTDTMLRPRNCLKVDDSILMSELSLNETPYAMDTILAGRFQIQRLEHVNCRTALCLGTDIESGEHVGIKFIFPDVEQGANERIFMEHSMEIMSGVTSPFLQKQLACGHHADTPFAVYEYVEGLTLMDVLAGHGALSDEQILGVGSALCEGLSVLHALGVLHRDIKPHNIVLTRAGDIKLIDFGLLTSPEIYKKLDYIVLPQHGTAAYMAPEVVRSEVSDVRADIYSLGCTLYELSSGYPPTGTRVWGDALYHQVHTKPEPLSHRRWFQKYPTSESERIIMRAIEKNPADRFQTIEEMKHDIDKAILLQARRDVSEWCFP